MLENPAAHTFEKAADVIRTADALVIAAGAGMGVDSGLPDFRGSAGFWKAYPPLARLGLRFEEIANPRWFDADPTLAWGFYGHRLGLYRNTAPHAGFDVLRRWAAQMPAGHFVFTSNVDSHFQRAGFAPDAIVECHGSLEWWQCVRDCRGELWPAPEQVDFRVDPETCRAVGALPACPHCGGMARPKVLMFGDSRWNDQRSSAQEEHLQRWLRLNRSVRIVVLELGAGIAIATVRHFSEELQRAGATLVRINPRDSHGPRGTISVAAGARAGLAAIARRLDADSGD